jgi:hypothetical protein
VEVEQRKLTSHRIFARVEVHLNISHLICNLVPLDLSVFAESSTGSESRKTRSEMRDEGTHSLTG